MWVLAATATRRLSGAVSPRARAGDAPERCPSRRSPLSSRWHQPAISAMSGAGSEQFPVEDRPGRGGLHSGCSGVGEAECLVITDGHWPEVKASAPPPAGPGPPPPGSRLGPRSPACGDGLGGPSGSAPLSRDAWPLSQLAHRAVDPGLPHVQALHRVQAGTPCAWRGSAADRTASLQSRAQSGGAGIRGGAAVDRGEGVPEPGG